MDNNSVKPQFDLFRSRLASHVNLLNSTFMMWRVMNQSLYKPIQLWFIQMEEHHGFTQYQNPSLVYGNSSAWFHEEWLLGCLWTPNTKQSMLCLFACKAISHERAKLLQTCLKVLHFLLHILNVFQWVHVLSRASSFIYLVLA